MELAETANEADEERHRAASHIAAIRLQTRWRGRRDRLKVEAIRLEAIRLEKHLVDASRVVVGAGKHAAIAARGMTHTMTQRVITVTKQQSAKYYALTSFELKRDVFRGRIRKWLRHHQMSSALLSIVYLVLVFTSILIEESQEMVLAEDDVPCDAQGNVSDAGGAQLEPLEQQFHDATVVLEWLDLAFLVVFTAEIALHLVADGLSYVTDSKLVLADASTVLISLALSILSATGVIDSRLEVMRFFRLLRLVKIAIAMQHVKARTRRWTHKSKELLRDPPTCNWTKAKRYNFPKPPKATADTTGAPATVTSPHGSGRTLGFGSVKPPPLAPKKFAAFLSHYKYESGADARYLETMLESMLKTDVFVDANDLADLSNLFTAGVYQSEMIVLLGTSSVLLRPWCLLELYEARKHQLPVLTFALHHHNFTPRAARARLQQLRETLAPSGIALIEEHIAEEGDSWERFVELVGEAVDPRPDDDEHGAPLYQVVHSMGSDSQVNLEIKGLISSMALVSNRSLQWNNEMDNEMELQDGMVVPDEDDEAAFNGGGGGGGWRASPLVQLLPCFHQRPNNVYVAYAKEGMAAARVLQTKLQLRLGRPLMLSGKWELAYEVLRKCDREMLEFEEASEASPGRGGGGGGGGGGGDGGRGALQAGRAAIKAARDNVVEKLEEAIDFGVMDSSALIVLLTPGLFFCPFTLLELHTAIVHDRTVVPVMLEGSGYDFATAPAACANFAANLEARDPVLYQHCVGLCAERGVTLGDMQATMKRVPNLLAVTMSTEDVAHPHGHVGHVDHVNQEASGQEHEHERATQFHDVEVSIKGRAKGKDPKVKAEINQTTSSAINYGLEGSIASIAAKIQA